MQEQSEVTQLTGMALDQALVRVKWPDAYAERMLAGTPILIWNDRNIGQCIGRHGMGSEPAAWANAADKVIEAEYEFAHDVFVTDRWKWRRKGTECWWDSEDTRALALGSAKRDYIARSRRLEPKPGAEAKPVCTCGHDYAEHNFAVPGFEGRGVCCSLKDSCLDYEPGPSAQPKPDAAGEAREYRCSKCGEELEDGFCPCENSITPLLDGNEKLCGSYENRLIDTIQQLKARSAPRNSALEEAIAALTARAEKAERERDEARGADKEWERICYLAVTRAETAEAELAAVHKRLDAISEEDRMTRNANS